MPVDIGNSIEYQLMINSRLPEMKSSLDRGDSPITDSKQQDFRLMSHPPLIQSSDTCACYGHLPYAKLPAAQKLAPTVITTRQSVDVDPQQDDVCEQSPRVQDVAKSEGRMQEVEQDVGSLGSKSSRAVDRGVGSVPLTSKRVPPPPAQPQVAQPHTVVSQSAVMASRPQAIPEDSTAVQYPLQQVSPRCMHVSAVPMHMGGGAIRPLLIQPMTHLDVCSNMDPHLVVTEPAWRHYAYLRQHTWWDSPPHSSTSPASSCASTSTAGSSLIDAVIGFDHTYNASQCSNGPLSHCSSTRSESILSHMNSTMSTHSQVDVPPSRLASELCASGRPAQQSITLHQQSPVSTVPPESEPTIEDRMELEEILHCFEEFYVPRNVVQSWAVLVETVHDPPEMMKEENAFAAGWNGLVGWSKKAAKWLKHHLN